MTSYRATFIHLDGSMSGGRLIGTTFDSAITEAKYLASRMANVKAGRVASDDEIETAEFPVEQHMEEVEPPSSVGGLV